MRSGRLKRHLASHFERPLKRRRSGIDSPLLMTVSPCSVKCCCLCGLFKTPACHPPYARCLYPEEKVSGVGCIVVKAGL